MIVLMLALAIGPLSRPVIEMGPPGYGFPIYFVRQLERPAPIPGYLWVEYNYHMQSKWIDDPGWGLYRTTRAPPNNRELFRRLGVPPAELWRIGRQEDCPEGWARTGG